MPNQKPLTVYKVIEKSTGKTSDIIKAPSLNVGAKLWQTKMIDKGVSLYEIAQHKLKPVRA